MASSYTTSLKIQEIGNGEQSGVWGTTTNTNWTLIEQAVAGVVNITMSSANYTLSNLNGVSDEARNMTIVVGGTNSGIYQVVAPLVPKLYVITNNTSGGYAITIGASTGSVVTIPNGVTAQVYCDGSTGFFSAQTGSAGNFVVNGTLTAAGESDTGNLTVGGNFSVSGTATAVTVASGTNNTQIATTAFVQTAVNNYGFTGQVGMWSIATPPTGWLICNGSAVSRTTYSNLFSVIGTTFGSGDGSTTFNIPNYRDRMPIGVGTTYATAVGITGGSGMTTLVTANMPSHNHGINDPGHTHSLIGQTVNNQTLNDGLSNTGSYAGPGGGINSAFTGITTQNTGSNTPFSTISPYLGIYFIIKT